MTGRDRKIRVLIVDDSAIVRKALSEIVSSQPDLEVAGTAADPFVARDKIVSLKPDVLTLDIEMPRMDGLTFLKKLMRYHPLPVVVISSLGQASSRAAIEALECGAVEVIAKPGGPYSLSDLRDQLARKIRAAAAVRPAARPQPALCARSQRIPAVSPVGPAARGSRWPSVIAMGASTGGVEALRQVLESLPSGMPPIVIVQHIPAVFSAEFARRLDRTCGLHVKEAADGDALEAGCVLIAPGNFHLTIRREGGRCRAVVGGGPPVHYQRPSVDVLFESVAAAAGKHAVAVLLTGMGADGAAGLLALRHAGARTIVQNEASCVVFGMPREAIRLGAAGEILPLDRIGPELARLAVARDSVRA